MIDMTETMTTVSEALTEAREAMGRRDDLLDRLERLAELDTVESGAVALGSGHVGYADGQDHWVDTLDDYLLSVAAAAARITEGGITEESEVYQALCDESACLWSQIGSGETDDAEELRKIVGDDWAEVAEFLGLEDKVACVRVYRYGTDWLCVETGMPSDPVMAGMGSTLGVAHESLETTAIQSMGPDSGLSAVLSWIHGQGWIDSVDELVEDTDAQLWAQD